jgi:uncharacterized membrane protein YoaK (UPF0700 family)
VKQPGGQRAHREQQQADRKRQVRDLLVVILTITTGVADAVCFLHLGHVFGSVITGNLVLIGVSAGLRVATLAEHAGVALAGYAAGVLAGAPIARERDRRPGGQPDWPPRVTACLAAELVLLLGFSAGWWAAGARPQGAAQLVLLGLAGAAMGMQSAAVRRLGQLSTTYLTSTLTGVLAALALRETPEGLGRSLAILAAIVAGALAGAATAAAAPDAVPVLLLVPNAVVLTCAWRLRPMFRP